MNLCIRHMHVHYENEACGELMDVTDWSLSCPTENSLWDMGGGSEAINPSMSDTP